MRINENKENNENNKEPSERFKRALKDLREIARNRLAQDTTVEAKAQTLKALIGRVLIIGKEEGLSHDFVSSQIQNTVGKDARDKIKNQTLIELLQTLVFPEYNKADPILPYHDEYIAFSVFNDIMKKYLSCTRKERRDIMRSDEEFHELVKERIAMHAGFKNSKEFGDRVKTLRVPKIPRGKELVWLAIGDPDPVMSEDDKKLGEVLSDMALVVVQAFKDLYPELYAESKLTDIMDNKKDEDGNPSVRLVLNRHLKTFARTDTFT